MVFGYFLGICLFSINKVLFSVIKRNKKYSRVFSMIILKKHIFMCVIGLQKVSGNPMHIRVISFSVSYPWVLYDNLFYAAVMLHFLLWLKTHFRMTSAEDNQGIFSCLYNTGLKLGSYRLKSKLGGASESLLGFPVFFALK